MSVDFRRLVNLSATGLEMTPAEVEEILVDHPLQALPVFHIGFFLARELDISMAHPDAVRGGRLRLPAALAA